MSDNTINQIIQYREEGLDSQIQKLTQIYELQQRISAGSAGMLSGGSGGSSGSASSVAQNSTKSKAVDINAVNKAFGAKAAEGFVSSRDIDYLAAVNSGQQGTAGGLISEGEYSIQKHGERKQNKIMRDRVSADNMDAQAYELVSQGVSLPDNYDAFDVATGKRNLRIQNFDKRQARELEAASRIAESDAVSAISLDKDIGYLARRGYDADDKVSVARGKAQLSKWDDIASIERQEFTSRASAYRWDERKERLGLGADKDNWDVLVGERESRRAATEERDANKDLRSRTKEAIRANKINDLGEEYAPNAGSGMDDEDIIQATGLRAEARRNRASIRTEQARVANIKVANRELGKRGIDSSEFLPDDASPDEVYAAQQDIRGMGPPTKTAPSTFKEKAQAAWDTFQGSYGGRFARGAMYVAGSSAAAYANSMEQEQMTGRPDYRGQGNAIGSAIGGVIGAGIGSLFPGYGTFIGGGVGMQLGGTIGQWSQVGNQQQMMTSIALQPTIAMNANYQAGMGHGGWGNTPPDWDDFLKKFRDRGGTGNAFENGYRQANAAAINGVGKLSDRAASQRGYIGENYWATGVGLVKTSRGPETRPTGWDTSVSTVEGMAAGYESTYQGILEAGENPDAFTDFPSEGTGQRITGYRKKPKVDNAGNAVGKWVDAPDISNTTTYRRGTSVNELIEQNTGNAINFINSANTLPTRRANKNGFSGGVGDVNLAPTATDANAKFITSAGVTTGKHPVFQQDEEDEPIYETFKTGTKEHKYQWYRENAEKWFGAGSDELLKKTFEPIYAAKPKTGDNIVDIITQFGGTAAGLYEQMLTPFGQKPSIGIGETTRFAANLGASDRAMTLAQLSVRDSGNQMLTTMENRMGLMVDSSGNELIPGAKSSIEYAKTRQGIISEQNKAWQDTDLLGYNMQSMRLQNQERRYEVNPYSPGNRMAMELTGLGMDRARIGELRGRESGLRERGMLSEQQEFDFESQIEGLETNRQTRIGRLVDGVANRLPSMAAGRPSFAGRIDSRQMTEMQFGLIDFPYRGAGALNDQQRQSQEHFLENFLDPSEINSRSRTFTLNNIGGRGSAAGTISSTSKLGPSGPINGGNISSTVTTVSAPTTESLLQQILQAVIAGVANGKSGLSGETNGIHSWIARTSGGR